MHKGELVTTVVQKTGQTPRVGRIRELKGDLVEVEWQDGHVSVITRESVRPLHPAPARR